MMNREIKAEWIKRLRSGKYQQGQNVLRSQSDAYCCQGVLCEIAVERGIVSRVLRGPIYIDGRGTYEYRGPGDDSSLINLPNAVVAWAEMDDSLGLYTDFADQTLIADNDRRGHTFAQIADTIEQYF